VTAEFHVLYGKKTTCSLSFWEGTSLAYRQRQVPKSSRTGFSLLALNPHFANGATDNKDSDGGGNGNTGSRVHGYSNHRRSALVLRKW
jgi:hypothetical protein